MADKKKGSGKKDKRGAKKKKLSRALKKNRRLPPFVMLKTRRRVMTNRYRRDWRTDKLNIQEDDLDG